MKKLYATMLVAAAAISAPAVVDAQTPEPVTITVGSTNGTFTSSNPTKTWHAQWTSTQTNPQLKIDSRWGTSLAFGNNMSWKTVNGEECLTAYPGDASQGVKYIAVPSAGYYVSHMSFDIKRSTATACTIIFKGATETTSNTEFKHYEADFAMNETALFHLKGTMQEHHVKNLQVTLTPILKAQVTYQWIDETGAHLTAPVVEEVTVGQSYTVNQPAKTFDYYTLVSNSPIQGTTITPAFNTNTIVTTVFHDERNVLHGVKSVVRPLTNVEANKSYVLFSQHVSQTTRDAFRYVKPEDNKIYGKSVAQLTDETPYFTWTFEGTATEGQYKIKNNGADLYVTAIAHNTQGSVGTEAGHSTIAPHPSDANTLSIGNAANNNIRWDGNPGPDYIMNAWEGSGAKITPYEYVIDPYFFVTVQIMRYAYENGTVAPVVVSTTKYPVKAGSDFALPTPPASISGEGYEDNKLKYTLGNNDLTNIQNHKLVQHYYDILNGVESIIGDSKATVIYDIYGRVYSEGDQLAPGIYIRNGKKFIVR